MFPFLSSLKKTSNKGGFTLFESLVALSMVTIIAGISFQGLTAYTEYFALRDSVRSLESTIRTAQGYAISIQDINNTSQFLGRFGVKVQSAIPDEIILFADTQASDSETGYNMYDGSTGCADDECLERTVLGRGIHITDVCTIGINDIETCGITDRVDVVFVRPRTDAHVYIDGLEETTVKEIRITMGTKSEERTLSVTVGATGFITSL